jgi:hypothetical protein
MTPGLFSAFLLGKCCWQVLKTMFTGGMPVTICEIIVKSVENMNKY